MAMPPSSPSCAFARPRVCRDLLATSAVLSGSEPSRPTALPPRSRIDSDADVETAFATAPTPAAPTPLFHNTRQRSPVFSARPSPVPRRRRPACRRAGRRQGLVATQQLREHLRRAEIVGTVLVARRRTQSGWVRRGGTAALRMSRAFSPSRRFTSTELSRRPSTSAVRPFGSMSAWSRWSSCSRHVSWARALPKGASADIDAGASSDRRDHRLLPERSRQSSDGDTATTPASARSPFGPIVLKPRSRRKMDWWDVRGPESATAPSSPMSLPSRLMYVRNESLASSADSARRRGRAPLLQVDARAASPPSRPCEAP